MTQFRQLAAIMFTDIVGYTSIMGNDEQKAFAILAKNRELQKPIIEKFNGRWIKELGDGVIASFNTVSDAVNAAIIIQQKCNTENDFQLRIGIHQGEVVFENDDIFGDGVNIASRIQSISNPGSIFISETAYKSISNKKEFYTKFLKHQKLKNVKETVKIYQVIAEGVVETHPNIRQKLDTKKILLLLAVFVFVLTGFFYFKNYKYFNSTEEKSVAILPFEDLSPEKDEEYLGDGLAEEIINSITIIKDLKVIGRTSSFQFKGKNMGPASIGEKLNVKTILEGSIQKSGNMLRITAKLIRVDDNTIIWSQRFDKESKDIFSIMDNIAKNIVEKLQITLSATDKPRFIKKETDPEIYSLFLKGLYVYKKGDFEKSLEYNLEAIKMDSLFAPSYAYIALAKIWVISLSGAFSDFNAIRGAKEYAYKAIRLDPDLAESYSALALSAWNIELDFETAKLNFEKSIELNPSASLVKNRYAYFLLWMGEFEKAEKLALDAVGSDPADHNGYIIVSTANTYMKHYKKAEQYIEEGQRLFPEKSAFKNLSIQNKFDAGEYNQVLRILKPICMVNRSKSPDNALANLSIIYYKKGMINESKEIFTLLKEKLNDKNTSKYYQLAKVYLQYTLIDSCFISLEKSFENRESDLHQFKIDPIFKELSQDPRYKKLYHRYGFDRYK